MSARQQAIERVAFERDESPEDSVDDPTFWEEVNTAYRQPDLLQQRIEEAVDDPRALHRLFDEITEFAPEVPNSEDLLSQIETYLGDLDPTFEPDADTIPGE